MSGGNIKVVVRCRPLNSRELKRGATPLIEMKGDQTIISKPLDARTGKESEDHKAFTFDKSYWSADKDDPTYADQQTVYNDLGEDLLNHAFNGYNCCIFAYGQTGSGKSYSMMGYGEDIGIIPRTCEELFNRINQNTDSSITFAAEVSYIEIYNEKVRDLLNPKNKGNLKVREHPSTGPYVEDLSRLVVRSFDDINHLMDEGNKARTVAATNMNETSSRSHAVFTVFLTQKRLDEMTKLETEKVARISLVDLAGSERANSTGATGARLKEGANINRSLTTLGKVIAGLAEQSIADSRKGGKKSKDNFIPYRDSVLTWLLKDSLGGNSKTAMIAAISPADYDETLSTLRYADQAKKIKNKAVVNEDPNAKMIRELKDELEVLRSRLHVYAPEVVEELAAGSVHRLANNAPGGPPAGGLAMSASRSVLTDGKQEFEFVDTSGVKRKMTKLEIVDQLQSSEKLLANLNETWEEKLKRTESIQIQRERALEELGIAVHKNNVGVYAPKKMPHLVNLNEDPLMSECLMYQLKPGITHVGRNDAMDATDSSQSTNTDGISTITLGGSNIQDDHCWFNNDNGVVTLHPKSDSLIMVNGMRTSEPRQLHSGYRIILGNYHIFRFNHPEEVRRERERTGTPATPALASLSTEINPMDLDNNVVATHERSDSPTTLVSAPGGGGSELMDWNYARLEAVRNYYSKEGNFDGMKDDELEKLFDDLTKIRKSRRSTRCGSLLSFDDFSAQSTATDLDTISTALTSTGSGMTALLGQTDYEEKIMVEKERLQKELNEQKQFYEAKINRMSMQFPFTDDSNYGDDDLAMADDMLMTSHQRSLLQKVYQQWRKLRYVAMAEVILTNAAILKEANIISRELEKETSYQFTIIEDSQFTNPRSSWESTYALQQFNTDDDTHLLSASKPCVGVRVLDRKHQVIYIWSLENLKTRLQQMKNLLDYKNQPQYRAHLNWEDPFYETPNPKYSFIGSAATSVRNLVLQKPYESFVEIICRSTGQVKGMLRVLISPVATTRASQPPARHHENGTNVTNSASSFLPLPPQQQSNPSHLKVGQQLIFEVRMLEICGLQESEYTGVHVQFRLSSFGGIPADSTAEKLFATDPVSGFDGLSTIPVEYSQTLSMTVTSSMLEVLGRNMINFEVYGVASSRVLKQYERWDDQREKPRLADLLAANNSSLGSDMDSRLTKTISSSSNSTATGTPTSAITASTPPNLSPQQHQQQLPSSSELSSSMMERPFENDFISMERHDVSAWLQISELLPNGDYMPVPTLSENTLDRGLFNLRQGLQRRITITLSHNSGRQFEWSRISRVTVGKIRLLDAKGRLIDAQSHEDIPIKLLAQQHAVVYNNDGTSQLIAQGAWDSSQHECLFLNRLTAPRSRILLQVTWEVETEKCSKPIQFNMEMAIRVTSRDSTSSGPTTAFRIKKLLGTASGTKYLNKCSGLFTVYLRPPMTRRVSQLWRLNTACKYIRGEEVFLGSWRPRGVSLVNDYRHIQDRIRLKEQAVFTSQVLTLHAARSQTSHGAMTKEKYQLEQSVSTQNNSTINNNIINGNGKKSDWGSDHDNRQQDLLQKVLSLWTSRLGTEKDIQLCQDPPTPGMVESNYRETNWKGTKLLAEVKSVAQTNNISKKGYLAYQEDPLGDKWVKRWCIIKRPYIYIYAHQNEQDELGVINISSVRIDHNKPLEKLLQRNHVFSLYTNNNAYTLQASSKSDMLDWIAKLDQTYSPQLKD
ncbi:hypothetical protein BCR42DRAFT_454115 [Absidia repens]|uniref:Kinesin-domain-containing protein n=1 Tax=Absidia repens TaxID=90262 RepID=A0A1X2I7P8_9FUNG|nr:hypothetical protein BCR42DRAFT_454115 [Absidia repens]